MVEQLNSYDTSAKLKIAVSNDAYLNNITTKDFYEKHDRKVTKFNFDETREFSKTTKKTNGRTEVESLLKYSIELEKGRKTLSNESTPNVEERDEKLKNIMDKRDKIQEIPDESIKILPEYKCDGHGSDYELLEDDFEDFITINPSGSVLAPSPNPYNKLDKIAEANLELTRSPPIKNSPTKVTFNDNITMLETSEDSESEDDSDGNESTTSVDSKLVNNEAKEPSLGNSIQIEEEPVEDVNGINPVVDESSIESVDDYTDNNSDDTSSNKSVLLVKVPHTSSEPLKNSADNSSESENEDVCVGHITQKISSLKNDFSSLENTDKDLSLDKMKVLDLDDVYTTKSEDVDTSPENNKFINAEELSVEDLNDQAFPTNYHEDYLKISETQAGITIKITCADSTDYSESNVCKNDEVFEGITENHNITSSAMPSKKVSGTVHREETKKKVNNSKSDVKPREPESKNNNSFSSRVRRKSVMHKKFLIKDVNGDNNCRRKKEGKPDNMNDSELLAERIFKSLCHNNKTNEAQLKNGETVHESRVLKQRNVSVRKSAVVNLQSKSVDSSEKRKMLSSSGEVCYCKHAEKERPKSSVVDRRRSQESAVVERPVTAPVAQRKCCPLWAQGRLPDYNGLHSEYGLSAEQLQERKREKIERNKARKQKKEEKRAEEERKRKENEERFSAWLVKKREQEKMKMIQTHLYYYQPNRLHLKNFCAPTAHLIKIGAYRKKQSRKLGSKNFSVDKFLTNISPQEKRTYRIYLGLSPD
ncbi:hypothetical protein LSTR_LSTR009626 [Laodelphax striatellus]|uniref:Coiled-coil domain-containing protein 181 n=1 Tax=Laodelphax striatellus TaxID=195883 RepID=A0A482WNC8_LAOST|nr:hypothetical protein LSTR_LSTR009626 [Laodelphax striatellus]